ncbi:hypothetical protein Ahy_B03g064466 [Arachis hypogaea]|uniref:ATP-dependent DNA helicase n=1 Tax=Arachis hypogaea TaxID=3818 RepID=A0A444ZZN2_ARAHY|nr:hypothetical protein Ahy_B03g064466 [Arachis hypogaea]
MNDVTYDTFKDVYFAIGLFSYEDYKHIRKRIFFFLYGHGGCGKMFLYNLKSSKVRSKSKIVLNMASNRIVLLLLPNSKVVHSRFKIRQLSSLPNC